MFTNPDHHDDVALSAEEKLAFRRLAKSVTPNEIDHPNAGPRAARVRRQLNHRPQIRRFSDRHLAALGRGLAGVGFAVAVAAMAVSLVVAVCGLVLMVLGIWCLLRSVGRPDQARDRAGSRARKLLALFRSH